MDMIGTDHILDVAPPWPRSVFYMFGISMLEIDDDDGLVATNIIHNTIFVEGASDSVDPPLSYGNNDMSIF